MKFNFKLAALAMGCLFFFSACSKKTPKHARLIPRDAFFVIGVSTEELGKKVAWSALSGSPLMKEMLDNTDNPQGKEAISGIDKSGIEWVSTVYVYGKRDDRYSGDMKVAMIAPLKDKATWEAYLKKVSPTVSVKTVKDRREAMLGGEMYAGWDNDVVIIMNGIRKETAMPAIDYNDTTLNVDSLQTAMQMRSRGIDELAAGPEMEAAFAIKEDDRLTENKHFRNTIAEAHDMSYFVNYDQALSSDNVRSMGMMDMGMSSFYKGSALAGSMDFSKGKVDGEMRFYPSDTMRPIVEKFGNTNIDKDMLERLNGQNLNMVAGYHLSTEGLRAMLDKMGMLGMANMALMKSGTTADEILSAFSGDMVFAMNNFTMKTKTMSYGDSGDPAMTYQSADPKVDAVIAIKIGKRSSLDKLVALIQKESGGELQPSSPNTYTIPLTETESVTVTIGEKYIVASNRPAMVQAFLAGKAANALASNVRSEIDGHPFGMFVDAQTMFNAYAGADKGSGTDSVLYVEARKLFMNASVQGGDYKDGASTFHFAVNLSDKNESSLLQILHMAERINAASKSRDAMAAKQQEFIP